MSKPTDIKLKQVTARTERFEYRTAMKFGGRVVRDATLLHVCAEVETGDGRQGTGSGSMPMSNVWAWPSDRAYDRATRPPMRSSRTSCAPCTARPTCARA